MPNYDYKCDCGHTFERRSLISERKIPLSEPCPECKKSGYIEQLLTGFQVVADGTRIGLGKKTDDGFKEVLAKIHERTPGSNLGDMLSRTPNKYQI